MFGSSVLDIAIGAVFIFLLLSVFATALHEMIFSFMNMRGRELLKGVATLLSDPAASGLVSKVYNHGQIFGLFEGEFDPRKTRKLPSYIPSRNFALALLGSIAEPYSEAPSPTGAQPAPVVHEVIVLTKGFKDAVQKLADTTETEKVGKPLVAMMNMAGNDAAKMQSAVEEWFNSGMDRVSGWYKYKTQWMLFVIGLCIACALNASTTSFVRQLSQDATMRASIVAAAESAKEPLVNKDETTVDRIADTRRALAEVNNIGVPLGWRADDWNRIVSSPKHAANTALGWLITAVAISLGAPFWFDMLNKIMVVRSTVKPREKSHDEGSKDKTKG